MVITILECLAVKCVDDNLAPGGEIGILHTQESQRGLQENKGGCQDNELWDEYWQYSWYQVTGDDAPITGTVSAGSFNVGGFFCLQED